MAACQPAGLAVSFVWRQMLQWPGGGKLLSPSPLPPLASPQQLSPCLAAVTGRLLHHSSLDSGGWGWGRDGTCVQRRGWGGETAAPRDLGQRGRAGSARPAHTHSPSSARARARNRNAGSFLRAATGDAGPVGFQGTPAAAERRVFIGRVRSPS